MDQVLIRHCLHLQGPRTRIAHKIGLAAKRHHFILEELRRDHFGIQSSPIGNSQVDLVAGKIHGIIFNPKVKTHRIVLQGITDKSWDQPTLGE